MAQNSPKKATSFSDNSSISSANSSGSLSSSQTKKDPKQAFQRFASRSNLLAIPKKKDQTKLWKLMDEYLSNDKESIQKQLSDHIEYTLARNRGNFDSFAAYQATGYWYSLS